ncbi:hypothetical protein LGH70_12000 [Hymenobacter sp. BT635]|uniref:MABP domain-containing protein n=1 Tax=Hymenobacter nitidus TaxID=2880929 RepID=A0ABS8AF15_9BACT|nr:hypothetical protein [Hymenobacter nitidus]MCB2378312.1 hypothetical protein [Hymenobacter nitidus]
MKFPVRFKLSALVLGAGVMALSSCSKEELHDMKPGKGSPKNEVDTSIAEARAAWGKFVSDVRAGVQVDPEGQYVKDGTIVPSDGVSARLQRPKFDMQRRDMKTFAAMPFGSGNEQQYVQPIDLEEPGDGGGGYGGGGGGSTPYQGFISSENVAAYSGADNPAGHIYDLKITKGGDGPLDGYTKIDVDLNRGAGGQYIYLTFTRNPSKVQKGSEWDPYCMNGSFSVCNGREVVGPVRGIWSQAYNSGGAFHAWPGFTFPTWAPNGVGGWKQPDLNDGAGGDYIYGYQSKDARDGNPIEVGVLYGSSSSVAPPAGWVKVDGSNGQGVDLNKGAGGDYVYFCYKRR